MYLLVNFTKFQITLKEITIHTLSCDYTCYKLIIILSYFTASHSEETSWNLGTSDDLICLSVIEVNRLSTTILQIYIYLRIYSKPQYL